ncbi:hypothetical protein NO995_01995 [Aestuariibaculum sp. M13]|uniref:hypothetical protein n=1 Tax=Aestuariibaculum sp. M13 TaxID=2967132 RepID=UPI002159E1DA|nr:hypothetical protein [Aestuariibaculum sp. M13]MCR8666435.1 hypothetical protein [Aestuariibaculum sp. M13]
MAGTNLKQYIVTLCGVLFISCYAFAHPLPGTKVSLKLDGTHIIGKAVLPLGELESAIKQRINPEHIDTAFMKVYFQKHVHVQSENQNWKVDVFSFSTFNEDDSNYGGHHGVIPFLVVNFKLEPSKEIPIEAFTFNYDAVIYEVMTHDIDVYQVFDNQADSLMLGEITLDVSSETFKPLVIQMQSVEPAVKSSSLFAGLGLMLSLVVIFVLYKSIRGMF